jgi:signal transduction histidine kinase
VSVDRDAAGDIAHGLHQVAQPITVLQGTLELALLTASTVEEYRHAIEQSLEELQRATDCFNRVRTLVNLHPPAPDVATFAASSMVKAILMNMQDRAASAGVKLILQSGFDERKDSGQDRLRMSRKRAATSLMTALSDLLLHLRVGSKVFVQIEEEEETADTLIRLHTAGPGQESAWADDSQSRHISRRKLAAIAASAGAELTFCVSRSDLLMPFSKMFLADLPAEPNQQKGTVSLCLV